MPWVSTSESTTQPPAWGPRRNSVCRDQGGGGSQGHPTRPGPLPSRPLCLAHLCLHHGGALGAQRVADGNRVRQHSALVALVATPGTQGHIWGREGGQNEEAILQSSAHRLWELAFWDSSSSLGTRPQTHPGPMPHPDVSPTFLLDP